MEWYLKNLCFQVHKHSIFWLVIRYLNLLCSVSVRYLAFRTITQALLLSPVRSRCTGYRERPGWWRRGTSRWHCRVPWRQRRRCRGGQLLLLQSLCKVVFIGWWKSHLPTIAHFLVVNELLDRQANIIFWSEIKLSPFVLYFRMNILHWLCC